MKGIRTSVMLAAICLGGAGSEAGSLCVANFGNSTISIVSPDSGNVITNLTTPICTAYGLVCDQANNLYVGNRGNGSVTRVAADGIAYSILASNLDAGAVAFGINSNLYTLGFYTGEIVQITPSGSVSTVASVGMAGGIALAYDAASSNMYALVNHQAVNGFGNAELYKIAPDATVSMLVDFSGFPTPYPQAMTIDTSGNLYVTATSLMPVSDAVIYKVTSQGNVSSNASLPNPQSEAFVSQVPFALGFDQIGRLNAYNFYDNTLYRVAPNGTLTTVASGLLNPRGTYNLAFDTNGRVYLLHGADRTILKSESPYSSSSVFVQGWLENPSAVVFDAAGDLFVANFNWGTIFKRTPDGSLSVFAALGNAQPAALAFDSAGNLYASNQGYGGNLAPLNSITKITPTGSVNTNFAHMASYPNGLAFDANGNLYVALHGGTIAKITTNGSVSTFANGLNSPVGLAFGSNAVLVVADYGNNAVYKVSTNGVVSSFVTGLDGPQSLAFDTGGNFYVGTFDVFNDVSTLLKINPAGNVVTLVNTNGGLNNPLGLAFAQPVAPRILSAQLSAGNFAFSFLSDSNQSYTIQGSLDLTTTNWFDYTNFSGNGLVIPVSVPFSNGVSKQFFRIKLP